MGLGGHRADLGGGSAGVSVYLPVWWLSKAHRSTGTLRRGRDPLALSVVEAILPAVPRGPHDGVCWVGCLGQRGLGAEGHGRHALLV